jgi:hypothetical protein
MTQLYSDDFGRQRDVTVVTNAPTRRKVGWALPLSLLFFIPVVPMIGMFLGLTARRSTTRLAGLATLLGLLFTLGQAFIGYRGYEFYRQITAGPGEALAAGCTGDVTGFQQSFITVIPPNDLEARSFIDDLQERYGKFRGIEPTATPVQLGSLCAPRSYVLVFEEGRVQATAAVSFDERLGTSWLGSGLSYLNIHDADRGDLTFPTSSAPRLVSQPATH